MFANYACCASCSTFFKDFHLDLAHTIKRLLGLSDGCQAILFSPRRGNTLDQFVKACHSAKLNVGITEQYDAHIWSIHKGFLTNDGNSAWPYYDEEHSYPLLLSITHTDSWPSTKGIKEPVPPMWNFHIQLRSFVRLGSNIATGFGCLAEPRSTKSGMKWQNYL